MFLLLSIPKHFEDHYSFDMFEDSLCRLSADAHCLAGNYEKALAEMLIDSFSCSVPFDHVLSVSPGVCLLIADSEK